MTTNDDLCDRPEAGMRSVPPPTPDLRISPPEAASKWVVAWVRKREVRLGHRLLGHVWELPDGRWATWAGGPRFRTVEEAAEHLRQQRLGGASLSGPLGGAEVTR